MQHFPKVWLLAAQVSELPPGSPTPPGGGRVLGAWLVGRKRGGAGLPAKRARQSTRDPQFYLVRSTMGPRLAPFQATGEPRPRTRGTGVGRRALVEGRARRGPRTSLYCPGSRGRGDLDSRARLGAAPEDAQGSRVGRTRGDPPAAAATLPATAGGRHRDPSGARLDEREVPSRDDDVRCAGVGRVASRRTAAARARSAGGGWEIGARGVGPVGPVAPQAFPRAERRAGLGLRRRSLGVGWTKPMPGLDERHAARIVPTGDPNGQAAAVGWALPAGASAPPCEAGPRKVRTGGPVRTCRTGARRGGRRVTRRV